MDNHRFDALVRALQPANRRSLLTGALGGVLGLTALALGPDEGDAATAAAPGTSRPPAGHSGPRYQPGKSRRKRKK